MLLDGRVIGVRDGDFIISVPVTPSQKEQIMATHKPDVVVEFEDGREPKEVMPQVLKKCQIVAMDCEIFF